MEGLHYPWKYIDCKVVDLPFSWNGVTFRFTHLLKSCQWSPFISWFHVNHYISLKYKNDSIIISVPGRAIPDGWNVLLSAVDNMWCSPTPLQLKPLVPLELLCAFFPQVPPLLTMLISVFCSLRGSRLPTVCLESTMFPWRVWSKWWQVRPCAIMLTMVMRCQTNSNSNRHQNITLSGK